MLFRSVHSLKKRESGLPQETCCCSHPLNYYDSSRTTVGKRGGRIYVGIAREDFTRKPFPDRPSLAVFPRLDHSLTPLPRAKRHGAALAPRAGRRFGSPPRHRSPGKCKACAKSLSGQTGGDAGILRAVQPTWQPPHPAIPCPNCDPPALFWSCESPRGIVALFCKVLSGRGRDLLSARPTGQ